jgi:subtilisin-like proprotein convertase family protein
MRKNDSKVTQSAWPNALQSAERATSASKLRNATLAMFMAVVAMFSFSGVANAQAGQCLGAGCAGPGTSWGTVQSTSSTTFVSSVGGTFGGEYNTYAVVTGNEYEWSLCVADGAVNGGGDTQLTLKTEANANLCYSDDLCGAAPKIRWTANFTGNVRVLVNQYNCATNSSNHTVVWRVSLAAPSGCTSATPWGGAAVSGVNGGSVDLTTCAFAGEYSPATGLIAANTYTISGTGGTGNYLTIRTDADALIQAGNSPQVVTGYTGNIRVLVHTNAACGTESICHTLTVVSTVPPPPPGSVCTYTSGSPVGIVDNTTVTSNIIVPASAELITDLNVYVNLNHTWNSDVTVTLTSPSATSVTLVANVCGSSDNMNVEFDDEAAAAIGSTCPPLNVYNIPANALSAFDGEPIAGTWTLSVNDNATGDVGTLNTWCLNATTALPAPGDACVYTSGSPVGIVDNTTVTSNIIVAPTAETLTDLNVYVNLNHTWNSDLTITLTSPSATSVVLVSATCGSTDNMNVEFDDEAGSPIGSTCPPIGVFNIPANALSAFDGQPLAGTWTLSINDNATGDAGTLNSWCLIPTTIVGPPPYVGPPYCNETQGGPGFAGLPACETAVCNLDPFCCDTTWDGICAQGAQGLAECAACLAPCAAPTVTATTVTDCIAGTYTLSIEIGMDGNGGTFAVSTVAPFAGPYCNVTGPAGFPSNPACQAAICGADAFCCNNSWDSVCAASAASNPACASCLTTAPGVATLVGNFTGGSTVDLGTHANGDFVDVIVEHAYGASCDQEFSFTNTDEVCGCMDPLANNYNMNATSDDGSCVYPPANNECVNAFAVTTGTVAVTNVNATGTDITGCTFNDILDVWYSFDASPNGGMLTVNTCGSSFDTGLALFDACGGTELACNDDFCGLQSQISVSVGGGLHYIRFAGYNGQSGTGVLNVDFVPYPVNNDCDDAIALVPMVANVPYGLGLPAQTTAIGTLYGATGIGTCITAQDVFYSLEVPYENHYTVTVNPFGGADVGFEVLDACAGVSLACINVNGPGQVESNVFLNVPAGNYIIRVSGIATSAPEGQFLINVQAAPVTKVMDGTGCNATGLQLEDVIRCNLVTGALDYEWRFVEVGGGLDATYVRGSNNRNLRLSWIDGIDYNKLYNVYVRAQFNLPGAGVVWGAYRIYGDVTLLGSSDCTVETGVSVTPTQVQPAYSPNSPLTSAPYALCNNVRANYVAAAEQYEWEFSGPAPIGTYCDQAQGSAGFPSNPACQADVCGIDPFCCDTTWDGICADEASLFASCTSCLTPASTILVTSPSYFIPLSNVPGIQMNTVYQVRVRARVNGLWGTFGVSLPVALGLPANTSIWASHCNTVRPLSGAGSNVAAFNVCASQSYTFRFQHVSEPERIVVRPTYVCPFNTVVPALTPGQTYTVSVKVTQGGVAGDYSTSCPITIAGPQAEGIANDVAVTKVLETGNLGIYPNPNAGTEVRVDLNGIADGYHDVAVTIYDIYGKLMTRDVFGHQGAELSRLVRFEQELATGMYLVHVTIDGEIFATEKLIVK